MPIAAARVQAAGGPLPAERVAHDGHGCCQDPHRRRRRRGIATPRVLSLVGIKDARVRPGLGLVESAVTAAGDRVPDRVTERHAIVTPLYCRSWSCRCCSWRLIKRNRARAFMGVTGAQRVALVTLTIDPEDARFQEALAYYRDAGGGGPHGIFPPASIDYIRSIAWPRFRTYLGREFGRVAWLRGLELTRAGIAHVHVVVPLSGMSEFWRLRLLIRGDEDGRPARRATWTANGKGLGYEGRRAYGLAERAGFGIVSDVQLARSNGDVARYIVKATSHEGSAGEQLVGAVVGQGGAAYAVKGAADLRMPKYTRRVSWSGGRAPFAAGWTRPTALAGYSWRVAPASAAVIGPAMARSGFVLDDPARGRVTVAAGSSPGRG